MKDFKNISKSEYNNHHHFKSLIVLCIVFIISIVIIVALSFSYNIKVNHKEVNIEKVFKEYKEVDKELNKTEIKEKELRKKMSRLIDKIKEYEEKDKKK